MPFDVTDTVLIVVGSELVPEEKDRPMAYRLKQALDVYGDDRFKKAIVVSDHWYLENPIFQACPTIILGGAGVNQAAAEFFNRIPLVWSSGERAFVHFTLSDGEAKSAIWGLTGQGTTEALETFITDGYLEQFITRVWKQA